MRITLCQQYRAMAAQTIPIGRPLPPTAPSVTLSRPVTRATCPAHIWQVRARWSRGGADSCVVDGGEGGERADRVAGRGGIWQGR